MPRVVLCFLFLCCLPSRAPAALPAWVQSCTANANGSCTLNGVVAGHGLIGLAFSCGNRSSLPVSDTFTSSWAAIAGTTISGNCAGRNTVLEIWYATAASSGNDTITISKNGNIAGLTVIFSEYSHLLNPITTDGNAQASCTGGCGTTASTGNFTTTQANDLLFSAGAIVGATGVMSGTNGYTQRATDLFPAGAFPQVNLFVDDKIGTVAGTYDGSWSISPTNAVNFASAAAFEWDLSTDLLRHKVQIIQLKPGPRLPRSYRIPWDRPRKVQT